MLISVTWDGPKVGNSISLNKLKHLITYAASLSSWTFLIVCTSTSQRERAGIGGMRDELIKPNNGK